MGHYRPFARHRAPARLRWLDEHEWVALDDRDALGALAYQRGHELQGVAGQGAARAAGDGDREGLGALVAGPAALSFQPVAASKAWRSICGGHGWLTTVMSIALM